MDYLKMLRNLLHSVAVAMTVKVLCKCYGRVPGCDLNPHSQSVILF
jgi:hypothetical protein